MRSANPVIKIEIKKGHGKYLIKESADYNGLKAPKSQVPYNNILDVCNHIEMVKSTFPPTEYVVDVKYNEKDFNKPELEALKKFKV